MFGRPAVRPSGRPAVRLSGCGRKLNVGFISQTMVPSVIKLGMIITTIELYALILLSVTFDLCIGHRFSIYAKRAVSVLSAYILPISHKCI